MLKPKNSLKSKPSLESLLAEGILQKGKQVIEKLKAKEKQLAEFANAAEFEGRHRKSNRTSNAG